MRFVLPAGALMSALLLSACGGATTSGTPAGGALPQLADRSPQQLSHTAPKANLTPQFTIADLGVVTGYDSSQGLALDAFGEVVGTASSATKGQVAVDFLGTGPVVLTGAPSSVLSAAVGINDLGTSTGWSLAPGGTHHAYLWKKGVATELPYATGWRNGMPYGINHMHEDVVGVATSASGATHAVLWKGGVMTDLGVLAGAKSSIAYGLNNTDVAVGESGSVAVVFKNGTVTSLGTLGGTKSLATAVIDAGTIVGASYLAKGQHRHAFVYTTSMQDLGALPHCSDSFATGINKSGDIIGSSSNSTGTYHAGFFYTKGVMYDLNALITPGSGWTIQGANAINPKDQITGVGTLSGQEHAFLLTRTQ